MDKPTPSPSAPAPGPGSPAADAADPYRQAREDQGAKDRAPQESMERAQVQEQNALDNVRQGYEKPTPHPERDIESTPPPPGPSDPYRQGP